MFQIFQMQKGESSDEYVLGEPTIPDESKRVKKRNRVLQSCISCHQLRRKCDRKRPCTRCTEHGVGGQCVYQLEDPAARDTAEQDELVRLRNRVADLERTVRVLMQRPLSRGATEALGLEVDEQTLVLRPIGPRDDADSDNGRGKSRKIAGRVKSEDSTIRHSPGPSAVSMSLHIPGTSTSPISPMPYLSPLGISPPQQGSSGLGGIGMGGISPSQVHCGCANHQAGKSTYKNLHQYLEDAMQKLKGLSEHQRGSACFVLMRVKEAYETLSTVIQPPAATPYAYAASSPSSVPYGSQQHSSSHQSQHHTSSQTSVSLSPLSGYQAPSSGDASGQAHFYQQQAQQSYQPATQPYSYHSSSHSHSHSQSQSPTLFPPTLTGGGISAPQAYPQSQPQSSRRAVQAVPMTQQPPSSLSSWDSVAHQAQQNSMSAARQVPPSRTGTVRQQYAQYDPRTGRSSGAR